MRRLEWLGAVLSGDEQNIEALKKKLEQEIEGKDAKENSSASSSKDSPGVAKVGPCPGYEGLVPLSNLFNRADHFRSCVSAEQIKEVSNGVVAEKKLFATLMQSCKASVNDLAYAREQKAVSEEKAKKAASEKEKAAAEAKKRAASKSSAAANKRVRTIGVTAAHPIFDLSANDYPFPTAASWSETWSSDHPFVLSGLNDIFSPPTRAPPA